MSNPAQLPPPPTEAEITLPWLLANKKTLAAYMAATYANANLQIVVIKNGVRQPPVAVRLAGTSATFEITV